MSLFEGGGTEIGAIHEGTAGGIQTVYQGDGTVLWSGNTNPYFDVQITNTNFIGIPDSAVSRHTFDDSDTDLGTALDMWGSDDATIYGATTGVSGQYGESYEFDGTDDYIELPYTTQTFPASISLWAYPISTPAHLYSNFTSSSNDYYIAISDDNEVRVANDNSDAFNTGSISMGSWNHIVVTEDVNGIDVYVDGSSVGSGSGSESNIDNGSNFRFGSRVDGADYFEGRIDDPRRYDKKLSSSEVSNLYNTGNING